MLTAEQKRCAADVAMIREQRHEFHGDDRTWTPNGHSGADIHRIGLLGEFAFCNIFGGTVDLTFRRSGDDGGDLYVIFRDGRRVAVDVKTSTYTGPNPYLRVPTSRMHTRMIYVAAAYDPARDDVDLVGWEYGHRLVHGLVRSFPPHYTLNYVAAYENLRSLERLRAIVRNPK